MSVYCSLATVPTLANATISTSNTSVGDINTYICIGGYRTTGASNPYITCLAATPAYGIWSNVAFGCERIATKFYRCSLYCTRNSQLLQIYSYYKNFLDSSKTAIPVYCDPATAPTLTNAYSPTPATTIGSTTSFTCLPGFTTTGTPSYTCINNGPSNGKWQSSHGSCTRMSLLLIASFP